MIIIITTCIYFYFHSWKIITRAKTQEFVEIKKKIIIDSMHQKPKNDDDDDDDDVLKIATPVQNITWWDGKCKP